MSLTTIIFSKNRPAQLDLLLRSMKAHAPHFAKNVIVIAKRDHGPYGAGYAMLAQEHADAESRGGHADRHLHVIDEELEGNFRATVYHAINSATTKVAFFVDDDVIYRKLPVWGPWQWLDLFPEALCFSLRLGLNTTECYSMRRPQSAPPHTQVGEFMVWDWRSDFAEYDFGYPGSLDGHIFRRDWLLEMLRDEPFTNPNQLEEVLVHACRQTVWPNLIASFKQSVLVGIPANSVSETHGSNRHGDTVAWSPERLNDDYLQGLRLSLRIIESSAALVNAAHVELPLVWDAPA